MAIRQLFNEHPASVGETYWQHLLRASWFAGRMSIAAAACFVHALLPFLFVRTGSRTVALLYDAMVVNRRRVSEGVDRAARSALP